MHTHSLGSKMEDHFHDLFEYAPVALIECDLSGFKALFDDLRANEVVDLQQYLDKHPETMKDCMHLMRVKHANDEALNLFGAASQAELLDNLASIFRDESLDLFRSQLLALWNGEVDWSDEGLNYRLSGEAIHIRGSWRILPEHVSTWDSVLVIIKDVTQLWHVQKRFNDLFEYAPISLWEQDYSEIKREFETLRKQGITDLRAYLDPQPEVVDRLLSMIHNLDVNQRTLELLEADDKEMLFANMHKVFRSEMKKVFVNTLVELWNGKAYYEHEGVYYSLSGKPINVHWHWTLMPGHEKDFSWVLVALQDINTRRRAEEYLRYLGTHDVMTALYNRAFFEEALQDLETNRSDPISFIVIDLNDLKSTNDSFGHYTGDRLIRRAADVLKASVDETYMVARIGGDEFVIIMPGTDEGAANAMLKRLRTLVSVNNKYYHDRVLSFAIGAATSIPGLSLEKVISLADDAMYRDKRKYYQRHTKERTSRT